MEFLGVQLVEVVEVDRVFNFFTSIATEDVQLLSDGSCSMGGSWTWLWASVVVPLFEGHLGRVEDLEVVVMLIKSTPKEEQVVSDQGGGVPFSQVTDLLEILELPRILVPDVLVLWAIEVQEPGEPFILTPSQH